MTELLAVPALRRILMVNTILSGAWDTHLFVVPIFGVAIGLSATTIGIILASFAAATFVIRLVLPLIQRRVRSWTLVRAPWPRRPWTSCFTRCSATLAY